MIHGRISLASNETELIKTAMPFRLLEIEVPTVTCKQERQDMVQVTIGVAAFNEEQNIEKLLDALIAQKDDTDTRIIQIIICDESSDETVHLVEKYAAIDRRVELYHHPSRRGKAAAINEIFANSHGDVVALFDADVLPRDDRVVVRLVGPMMNDPSIGVCGGASCALEPRTLMERVPYFAYTVWRDLRSNLRGGSNFFAIHGKIMGVSSQVSRRVRLPKQVIGDDGYIYLSCVKLGYQVRFVPDAIVYYQETRTLRDFLERRVKYEHNLKQLIQIFGDLGRNEVTISRSQLVRASLWEGTRDPLSLLVSAALVIWTKLYSRAIPMKTMWNIAKSTKRLDVRK